MDLDRNALEEQIDKIKGRFGFEDVVLAGVTIGLLKFHQKRQENHKKTVGIYHEKDNPEGLYHESNLVFATDDGRPINPRTFTKHFSSLLEIVCLSG